MPRLFLRSHTAPCCSQTTRPVTAACGFRRSGTYAPAAAIAARQLRGLPASLLSQIQLSDLIAGTGAEYVEVAAALARDPPAQRLTLIVAIARRGVPILCDESAYRVMWGHWVVNNSGWRSGVGRN
jgi:hypothetical protein